MKEQLETRSLYRHKSPKSFSANPEFCRPSMKRCMKMHGIYMSDGPLKSLPKNDVFAHINGTFNECLMRLSRERALSSPTTMIYRKSLVTKLLHGTSLVSNQQLAKSYRASILCVFCSSVTDKRINEHIGLKAKKAIQKRKKALNSRMLNKDPRPRYTQDERYMYYIRRLN